MDIKTYNKENNIKKEADINTCTHTFIPLQYFYDDDWGYKGSAVFFQNRPYGQLECCSKCGIVRVKKGE